MDEVRAVPDNGLRVASTFAGCGGSCLGYRMAGYRVLWANDNDPHAAETYAVNFPDTALDRRDVHEVTAEDVLEACDLAEGELDVLDGSPPCQSFSTAGKRRVNDPRGTLFGEFARILAGVRPRAFVAENVPGMAVGTMRGMFKAVHAMLRDVGYRLEVRRLDAQWLGVPQSRRRLIFVGVREDLDLEPAFPSPMPWRYSVAEACPWLTRVVHDTSGLFGAGEVTDRPYPAVTVGVESLNMYHFKVVEKTGGQCDHELAPDRPVHTIRAGRSGHIKLAANAYLYVRGYRRDGEEDQLDRPAPSVIHEGIGNVGQRQAFLVGVGDPPDEAPSLEGTALGEEAKTLKPGEKSRRYLNLVSADPKKPSPTVTSVGGSHPGTASVVVGARKFSILELKRVCSFPDDFEIPGSYAQQWARLGNAVPPLMMRSVAETLAPGLTDPDER